MTATMMRSWMALPAGRRSLIFTGSAQVASSPALLPSRDDPVPDIFLGQRVAAPCVLAEQWRIENCAGVPECHKANRFGSFHKRRLRSGPDELQVTHMRLLDGLGQSV